MLNLNLPPELGGFNPSDARTRKPAGTGRHRIRALCAMGSNMRIKFTKANIEALEAPPRGEIFVWAENKPGWGIRVLASGRNSWIVQFRDAQGKSRRHTIGDLRIVPITMAEQRASELLANAKLGKDLLSEERAAKNRRKADAVKSVGAMVAAYLAEPEVGRRRSFAEVKRYLELHWNPVHGESAEAVTRHELTPLLRRIAAERGEVAANRARSALSGMFTHAIVHGWLKRETNPCQHLPKWAEASRERVLSLDELRAVWAVAPEVNAQFGAVLRLLTLTGCRKSEIAGLRWSEVDFDRALISLPASRVKGNRAVTISLAPAAVEILRAVPRISDTLVFVGIGSWSWPKRKLDELVQLPQPWTIHDIRRSCRSLWIDGEHGLGLDVHLCELMLGHALPGILGVYDRGQRLPERRRALEAWARLVTGEAAEAKVVQLR
jgi:integrase